MTCPYCGSEDVDLTLSPAGGAPAARCAKCGADLDPAALATQVEASAGRSRSAKIVGGIAGAVLLVGLLIGLARPHSQPARSRVRERSTMSVPASETVCVTRTGMKFHRADCKYLRQGADRMSHDEALTRGYAACSVCQP